MYVLLHKMVLVHFQQLWELIGVLEMIPPIVLVQFHLVPLILTAYMVRQQLSNRQLLLYYLKLSSKKGSDSVSIINAGLPNITGEISDMPSWGGSSGAISSWRKDGVHNDGGTGGRYAWNFDASRSSSIYGASNTVQPPTIALIPQIKF